MSQALQAAPMLTGARLSAVHGRQVHSRCLRDGGRQRKALVLRVGPRLGRPVLLSFRYEFGVLKNLCGSREHVGKEEGSSDWKGLEWAVP